MKPVVTESVTVLSIPSVQELPFVLVDCGARAMSPDLNVARAFPRTTIIGFEPDAEECARLNRIGEGQCRFFPVAVGERAETRQLFVTRSPECSSFYRPNTDFLRRFRECETATDVVETQLVQAVPLGEYLPRIGVNHVDLLKIDVQGAELAVLRGSERFLKSHLLAVQTEVEFSEMYLGQPLFADVDNYLRKYHFALFDLSRVRYRRTTLPPEVDTRCQLLWGDALYLRDFRYFAERSLKEEAVKLAVLASAYGFHDYALEIVQHLLHMDGAMLTDAQLRELTSAQQSYISELSRGGRLARLVPLATLPPLRIAISKALHLHQLMEHRKPAWAD